MIAATITAAVILACIAGLSVVTAGIPGGRHRVTRWRR